MQLISSKQEEGGPFIVVVGATSCIAIHCVNLWLKCEKNAGVFLIGRNADRLRCVANDMAIRFPEAHIKYRATDLCCIEMVKEAVNDVCELRLPTTVLIAHGMMPNQVDCERDLDVCRNTLEVNAISPVLWAESFVEKMQNIKKSSRLILIGSVAGDRGRQANYIYGAAKGLMERYAQGLRHRLILKNSNLKIILVKPGPTATPMTEHLLVKGVSTLASVEAVARTIVAGAAKGGFIVYAPKKWKLIMLVIRWLPDCIFNRLNI